MDEPRTASGNRDLMRLVPEAEASSLGAEWSKVAGSPLKKRIVEGNIETLKFKNTTSATRAIAFTRNCNQEDYLPFILEAKKYAILEENGKVKWNRTKVKGWKDAKVYRL